MYPTFVRQASKLSAPIAITFKLRAGINQQNEPSASESLGATASSRKKSQNIKSNKKGDEGTLVVYQANAGVADDVRACQAFQSVRCTPPY